MPAKRGGSSTQGKYGATAEKKIEKKSEPSAMDAQNVTELIDYMQQKYDFAMRERDLNKGDFEAVKEQVSAFEEILQEFPEAKSAFLRLSFDNPITMRDKDSYAETNMENGLIKLNVAYFSSKPLVEEFYNNDTLHKYHPQGTSSKHIMSHEAGHILERAMAMKYLPGPKNFAARADAFDSRRFADEIIRLAVNNIGKSLKMSKTDLRRQVSKYAMENMSETLAECVADYMANKSKARPLSKEVYKILKQELG